MLKESGDDDDVSDDDDETDPLRGAKSFIRSFSDQAQNLWESLVSPYSKQAQDLTDFIAENEEEEEGEDEHPHHVFNKEEAAAEQDEDKALAEYYERRERKSVASDGEESSIYADEDDLDQAHYQQQQQSSESEDDDWVKGIRSKSRKKSFETGTRVNGKASNGSGQKKIAKRKRVDSDSDLSSAKMDHDDSGTKKAPSSAKRAVLEDSD